jgi:predicted metal-binding membrane protein
MPAAMSMPMPMTWSAGDFGFMFAMWAVMMVAMMLPSATPMILIFSKVAKKREADRRSFTPTWTFLAGYLLVWTGFSVIATALNWFLHDSGTLTSMMGRTTPVIGGILLIAAGIFQWTTIKDACLAHCRSPLGFLMSNWREGASGALAMGLKHGVYCLGCCWMLMVLLFVMGVMNLLWIVALTLVVLAEKVLPKGRMLSRALGVALVIWGAWLITVA